MSSLRAKLLVLLIVFAIVPAAVVAFLALGTFQGSSKRAALSALGGIVRAKAEAIDAFTDTRKRDVQRMADLVSAPLDRWLGAVAANETRQPQENRDEELPKLRDAEDVPPQNTPAIKPNAPVPAVDPPAPDDAAVESAGAELRHTLGLLLGEQATFEELLILAADGRVVVSTFREHEGTTAAELEYFRRGRASTYVQPVFQSPITGELTMVVATPIRDAQGKDIGVLAARLNLARLYRLINDYTGLGISGETLVGKHVDGTLIFMAPTRHAPDAAEERKSPGSGEDLPLVQAARGQTGAGTSVDYRGVPVLAAWTYVPALEWGVAVKIDVSEAEAPARSIRGQLLVTTLVVSILALVLSILVGRAIVQPLRKLQAATDAISKGDFDVELDIHSKDEIGELADSFERMVAAIKYFRERARADDDSDNGNDSDNGGNDSDSDNDNGGDGDGDGGDEPSRG